MAVAMSGVLGDGAGAAEQAITSQVVAQAIGNHRLLYTAG
jgi:hypothetical protein